MPKRVVDGEGLWRSEKLLRVQPEKFRAEYANQIPLALANGVFECDERRVWSLVYAFNRPEVSIADVVAMHAEFDRVGMLFRWETPDGKRWGFWVGIERPGRLPSASRLRTRHETLGPEPPESALKAYVDNHRSPNGQPTVALGFGLGSGSGLGSGKGTRAVKRTLTRAVKTRAQTDPLFAKFWADYPRKIRRKEAEASWRRLSEAERLAAVEALGAFIASDAWQEQSGKFVPAPDRFLREGRWKTPPSKGGSNANGNRKSTNAVNSRRGTDFSVGRTVLPEL
jgi:hypothetical protein